MDLALKNWADIAAVASCAQLIVVSAALAYAHRQFKEADRNRRLTAIIQLFSLIGEDELRALRRWVLNEAFAPFAIVNSMTGTIEDDESYQKVRRLAVGYDRVGYMIEQDVLPLKPLLEFQRDEIERLWQLLKPVILHIRQTERRPNYCIHFEALAGRARAA